MGWEYQIIRITKKENDDFSCEGPSVPFEERF
jgi:hypothetical protein